MYRKTKSLLITMTVPCRLFRLFFTSLALVSISVSPVLSCPRYQREALLQFKSLLLGNRSADTGFFQDWNSSSTDCCQWPRVTCTYGTDPRQVTHLSLSNIVSVSTLTFVASNVLNPLFHLRSLVSLDISYIGIQGEIPGKGLANLTQIVTLRMGGNSLSGSIPPELFSLTKLQTLELGNNLLEGTLPNYLGNLSNLVRLDLSGNSFHGEIPPSIQNITELTLLSNLDLSRNNLDGTFPFWSAQKHFQWLNLSDNKLTGPLPNQLFSRFSPRFLDLSNNSFSGRLPDTVGEAQILEVLDLSGNNLDGSVPKSISNLSRLCFLDLSRNKFTGQFPAFSPNSNLACLDLSSNRFSGNVPVNFPPSMNVLVLSQNEFSGSLPNHLQDLSQLIYLDLHDNNITGLIPFFLFHISTLQVLNLRNNSFHGPIPEKLSNISSLRILDLSSNNLSGEIPPSLGKLPAMVNLSAPHEIVIKDPNSRNVEGYRTQHPDLEVSWKKFYRKLSRQLLDLYVFLDLSSNKLSGAIPDSLGGLKSLKLLNISYNNLSGWIPATFGDLNNLESLDLSHNNLSGEIPQSFGQLQQLNDLDLSNNKLVGRIPDGPQIDRLNNRSFYANNSGLCGWQIQIPCDEGPTPKTTMPAERESDESSTWFSWETAGIGYAFGLSTTVLCLYVSGYFIIIPQRWRPRRRRARRHFSFFVAVRQLF